MKAPVDTQNAPLSAESCIFEVATEIFVEFPFSNNSRVIFRAMAKRALSEQDCMIDLSYLSSGQNVLLAGAASVKFSNSATINPNSVVSRRMDVCVATTVSFDLERVLGAFSVVMRFRKRTLSPIFIRRDMIRIFNVGKNESATPHSVVLTISEQSKPRYLARCKPGPHVLTSRSCIGVKGLMLTIKVLDKFGKNAQKNIGEIAFLHSLDVGAIAIPRARRLDRPDRFNKAIDVPKGAHFFMGDISSISTKDASYYDVLPLKLHPFRREVGIAMGTGVFENVSLGIYQSALARSRQDYLALLQSD